MKLFLQIGIFLCLVLLPPVYGNKPRSGPATRILKQIKMNPALVNMGNIPGLQFDIRYAGVNNFTGRNLYGDYNYCFLHKVAAAKIKKALLNLKKRRPGWRLLIFDCLRPRSVQKQLWKVVKGTSQQPYVADPAKGSIHNYGFAIDLSLADDKGKEIDMGTEYDNFTTLARPTHESVYLKKGKLTSQHIVNRKILRKVMTDAGFIQLPYEWWHYDALPGPAVRRNHRIVE